MPDMERILRSLEIHASDRPDLVRARHHGEDHARSQIAWLAGLGAGLTVMVSVINNQDTSPSWQPTPQLPSARTATPPRTATAASSHPIVGIATRRIPTPASGVEPRRTDATARMPLTRLTSEGTARPASGAEPKRAVGTVSTPRPAGMNPESDPLS